MTPPTPPELTAPKVDYDSDLIRSRVTTRLLELGYTVNPTVPGYTLADTLRRFQQATLQPDGSAMSPDGGIGNQTYTALFTAYVPVGATLANRVVAVGKAFLGVSEVPPGSNKGPQVSRFLANVNASAGSPWCMSYVWSVFNIACGQMLMKNPLPKTAGCMDMWRRAGALGIRRIPVADARKNPALIKPGMLPIWLIVPATGAGHTGIVAGWDGDRLITYEGNSNENGSREGLIVARQTKRRLSDKILVGFIDPYTA